MRLLRVPLIEPARAPLGSGPTETGGTEILLPASSGSDLEADSLRKLEERLAGRRVGVVGDLPLWGPEALLSAAVLAITGLYAAGGLSEVARDTLCVLGAVTAASQLVGAGLLDFLFARTATWAVVVGPLDARTTSVVAIPTDHPVLLLQAARVVLVAALALVPMLPALTSLVLLAGLPLLLAFRGRVPEIAAQYRIASGAVRAVDEGVPIVLCGGSRRDACGIIGTMDWLHAEPTVVVWIAGTGGSCDVVTRRAPWKMTPDAIKRLLDPAVLRLWLRGFEVRVVGVRPAGGELDAAVRHALRP